MYCRCPYPGTHPPIPSHHQTRDKHQISRQHIRPIWALRPIGQGECRGWPGDGAIVFWGFGCDCKPPRSRASTPYRETRLALPLPYRLLPPSISDSHVHRLAALIFPAAATPLGLLPYPFSAPPESPLFPYLRGPASQLPATVHVTPYPNHVSLDMSVRYLVMLVSYRNLYLSRIPAITRVQSSVHRRRCL
jgi:hypothetical protein